LNQPEEDGDEVRDLPAGSETSDGEPLQSADDVPPPPTTEYRRIVSDPGKPLPKSAKSIAAASAHAAAAPSVPPKFDMKQEWSKLQQEQKAFPHSIVQNLDLSCSLDQFVEQFFANEAPYSLPKYLESRGDSSLKASEWNPATSNSLQSKSEQKRVINYFHPVNAPLAPPKAGARKEQTLKRFGNVGLCLETRTIVDDVPMADCFYVQDRICVQQEENGVVVNMEFEITFIKSTMFKSIISKTTQSEFADFFKHMAKYMTNALGVQEKAPTTTNEPAEPEADLNEVASAAQTTSWIARAQEMLVPHLTPVLLAWILLLQFYILLELRDIKKKMTANSSSSVGGADTLQQCVELHEEEGIQAGAF